MTDYIGGKSTFHNQIIRQSIKEYDFSTVNETVSDIRLLPYRRAGAHSLLTFHVTISHQKQYVVKLPRHDDSKLALQAIQAEFRALKYLSQFKKLEKSIAIPAKLFSLKDTYALVTPFYQSREFYTIIKDSFDVDLVCMLYENCLKFLIALNKETRGDSIWMSSEKEIERNIYNPFNLLSRYFPNDAGQIKDYIAWMVTFLENLENERGIFIPRVFEHKEYNPYNINIKPDFSILVLDWEDSIREGMPFMDMFNLSYITFLILCDTKNAANIDKFISKMPGYLNYYCDELKLPAKVIDIFFLLFLLQNTCLFLEPKREELEYSRRWWLPLKLMYKKDIFFNCLRHERSLTLG